MSLLLGAWSVKVWLGWFEVSVVRLLDRFDGAPRAPLADQLRLVRLLIASAKALSYESPTVPVEGTACEFDDPVGVDHRHGVRSVVVSDG